MIEFLTLLQVLDSSLRLATPLLLVCLAGLFSERAGIFDIGLEGKLLAAAFVSAFVGFCVTIKVKFPYCAIIISYSAVFNRILSTSF